MPSVVVVIHGHHVASGGLGAVSLGEYCDLQATLGGREGVFGELEGARYRHFLHLVIREKHAHLGFFGNDVRDSSTELAAGTWAHLAFVYDKAARQQRIYVDGKQVASGQLTDPTGRRIIEQFLSAYMNFSLRGAPKVVSSPGHSFSDVPVKCLHLVNLASVRELERTIGRAVDPLRFRANVYFDTDEPWEELSWVGKQLSTDSITLSVIDRTQRCEATNVNPEKGIRDMAIPTTLQRTWGHSDFGIYAKVASDGELVVGNELKLNL